MNEGSRWIRLPLINMTMQTSDLAKLALFMYLASLLSKKQDVIKDFKKGFLPVMIPVAIICLLIAPANFSTALLLGASCLMLLFIGRARTKHILLTMGIAMIPILFLIIAAVASHKSGNDDDSSCKKNHLRDYLQGWRHGSGGWRILYMVVRKLIMMKCTR